MKRRLFIASAVNFLRDPVQLTKLLSEEEAETLFAAHGMKSVGILLNVDWSWRGEAGRIMHRGRTARPSGC
jgi:hypothetical protein